MFGLGGNELLIVLVIVLVLFGGAKVPQLMKGLGEGMREFRKATHDGDPENNKEGESISSHKA
jgi:sec-independent protein translocase protein TatA